MTTSTAWVDAVIAGDQRAVARAITDAESGAAATRPGARHLYEAGGNAHVIGVTGPPGVGKSTLVAQLVRAIRGRGQTVAVLAIDPSSPYSGGAILGDRIRMHALTDDPGVFIRSMATRGSLGGLAGAALDAVDVLDAAGFDRVIVETVGVGQDEVDVARGVHTVVVVSVPGLGDDIQMLKSGVMEIADVHVVNKADRPDADRTFAEVRRMLHDAAWDGEAWQPLLVATSSISGAGVPELLDAIESHRSHLLSSGEMSIRLRAIGEGRVLTRAQAILQSQLARLDDSAASRLITEVASRHLDPGTAAERLLGGVERRERAV